MEKENFIIKMEDYMMVNGKRIKCMEKVKYFQNILNYNLGSLFYASGKPAYEGDWNEDKFHGIGVLHNEIPMFL